MRATAPDFIGGFNTIETTSVRVVWYYVISTQNLIRHVYTGMWINWWNTGSACKWDFSPDTVACMCARVHTKKEAKEKGKEKGGEGGGQREGGRELVPGLDGEHNYY